MSSGKHIILKIAEEGLFYNDRNIFFWDQTNFPDKSNFTWRERTEIYWRLEMQWYDRESQTLVVEVIDYETKVINGFFDQKPKYPIRKLQFQKMSWPILQGQLRSYVFGEIFDFITNTTIVESEINATDNQPIKPLKASNKVHELEKKIELIEIDFDSDVQDLAFRLGYVTVAHYISEIDEYFNFKFYNDFVLPEFDHIKPYFKKVFNGSYVRVSGKVTLVDGEWVADVSCPDVMKINQDALLTIRRLVIQDVISSPKIQSVDKDLFTSDDLFLDEQDVDLGKAFLADDMDLVEEILELKGIRNRKQLLYLSDKVQNKKVKIRFTLAPQFGFVFYHKGEEMHHFIWELLDNHATYIWSIQINQMSPTAAFKRVSDLINVIRTHGRIAYLTSRDSSDDFIFMRIPHTKVNSKFVDAFPRWKAKLDERLV